MHRAPSFVALVATASLSLCGAAPADDAIVLMPLFFKAGVLPVWQRNVDSAMTAAVEGLDNPRVLWGAAVQSRLGRGPREAALACEAAADLQACFHGLAKELEASTLVLARGVALERKLELSFFAWDEVEGRIGPIGSLTIPQPKQTAEVLTAEALAGLLGLAAPEVAPSAAPEDVSARPPPGPTVQPTPVATTVAHAPEPAPPAPLPAPALETATARPAPTATVELSVVVEPPWWTPLLRYAGVGVAAGGGALAAAGLGLRFSAQSNLDSMRNAPGLSQVQAYDLYNRAIGDQATGDLLLGVGVAVVAVGAGMFIADLIAAPEPSTPGCTSDAGCPAGHECRAGACSPLRAGAPPSASLFTVRGVVLDAATRSPIIGARVKVGDEPTRILVDEATGAFALRVPGGDGLVRVTVEAAGYQAGEAMVALASHGESEVALIALAPSGVALVGEVRGSVRHAVSGKPVAAQVVISSLGKSARTDGEGAFNIEVSPAGEYDVIIWAKGFITQRKRLRVEPGGSVILNVDLTPDSH